MEVLILSKVEFEFLAHLLFFPGGTWGDLKRGHQRAQCPPGAFKDSPLWAKFCFPALYAQMIRREQDYYSAEFQKLSGDPSLVLNKDDIHQMMGDVLSSKELGTYALLICLNISRYWLLRISDNIAKWTKEFYQMLWFVQESIL